MGKNVEFKSLSKGDVIALEVRTGGPTETWEFKVSEVTLGNEPRLIVTPHRLPHNPCRWAMNKAMSLQVSPDELSHDKDSDRFFVKKPCSYLGKGVTVLTGLKPDQEAILEIVSVTVRT
jgi:hypothetical protein